MNEFTCVHPFSTLPVLQPDSIFGLLQTYLADTRSSKVNLGIGMYCDEQGKLPVLESVRQSIRMLKELDESPEYLPMAGYAKYCQEAQRLVFGDGVQLYPGCLATIQTLGGSGALKIGAEVLKKYCHSGDIWISEPGWENHAAIFRSAGFQVHYYPYLAPDARSVDFEGMLRCFESLPRHTVVLIHTCCHNPSGMDLSRSQWETLVSLFKSRALIPFLDFAYQGFGSGIHEDALPIRLLTKAAVPFLVASSFSKNFALYNQRCGVLSAFCISPSEAQRMQGVFESVVRSSYSNPPAYGARIIAQILSNASLRRLWQEEVDQMRQRITAMRQKLIKALVDVNPRNVPTYLGFSVCQGMFIITGLTSRQVRWLRKEYGIYLVENGRLCLAGLNGRNVGYVASGIAEALVLTA